jgi:hypothetical protein
MWNLPAGLPRRWGAKVTSSLARAFLQRKVRGPLGHAVSETLGVSGTTVVPLSLAPATCYLGAVAPARGEARPLALSVRTDRVTAHDVSGITGEATVVGFCTGASGSTSAQVDARGSALAWVLTVWRSGPAPRDEAAR